MRIAFNNLWTNNNTLRPRQNEITKKYSGGGTGDVFVKSSNTSVSFGHKSREEALQEFAQLPDEIKLRLALDGYLKMAHKNIQFMKDYHLPFFSTVNTAFSSKMWDSETPEYVKMILRETNIDSFDKLEKFMVEYEKSQKTFPMMEINAPMALYTYDKLNDKTNLGNFPEYISIFTDYEYFEYRDINEYFDFFKKLGVKNETIFLETFSHLKENYNNFETMADKAELFADILETYNEKIEVLKEVIDANPILKNAKADKLYLTYCDIVDYFYDNCSDDFGSKIETIILQDFNQPKISQRASEIFKDFMEIDTAEGKIALFDFLKSEDLSLSGLNSLVSSNLLADISADNVVFNRLTITEYISDIKKEWSKKEVEKFYSNFSQILNAALINDNSEYNTEGIYTIIKTADMLDLKNEKDFLNLYLKKPHKNSKKSPKQQAAKPTGKEIREFTELLAFMDKNCVQMYKKNKNYPLADALLKRKQEFETLKPKIEQWLDEENSTLLSLLGAYEIYMQLDLKECRNLDKALEKVKENLGIKDEFEEFKDFIETFPDKKSAKKFIIKNGIKNPKNNEDTIYHDNCLRIAKIMLQNKYGRKDFNYCDALLENDFIKNSRTSLAKIAKQTNDKELRLLFETILEKDIENPAELKKLLGVFSKKGEENSNLLEHFKNQKYNLEDYLTILGNIQERFNSLGMPVEINNNTIKAINTEDLSPNRKITTREISALAKEMLNAPKGRNFLSGFMNSFSKSDKKHYNSYDIASEIAMNYNADTNSYANIARELKIEPERLNPTNSKEFNYANEIAQNLGREFMNFINSNDWLQLDEEEKEYPNLSCHARLRLIDRFALTENGSIEKLYSQETKEKLRNIIKTIYYDEPTKIFKGNSSYNDKIFILNFEDDKDNSIKTYISKTGRLISVYKN